jgi:hypothetical protein
MLPVTLQFMIVMIASAINDRLQRKLGYVEEERRILREQLDAATGGKKLLFTTDQRRRLATAGKLLTPDERRKCCELVKPATILAWFRQLAARKYDSSEARRGRPPKPKDVRKQVSIRPSAGGLTAALARNLAESPWHGHGCPAKERADGKALERHNSA